MSHFNNRSVFMGF